MRLVLGCRISDLGVNLGVRGSGLRDVVIFSVWARVWTKLAVTNPSTAIEWYVCPEHGKQTDAPTIYTARS